MDNAVTDPTFITALATLIASVVSLLKVLQVERQAHDTHETLKVVDAHTNGQLAALQQAVTDLRAVKATQSELDARPQTEVQGQP